MEKIKTFFHHSVTILVAWVQMVFGGLLGVLLMLDPNLLYAVVPQKYLWVVVVGFGIATFYARKRTLDT